MNVLKRKVESLSGQYGFEGITPIPKKHLHISMNLEMEMHPMGVYVKQLTNGNEYVIPYGYIQRIKLLKEAEEEQKAS